VKYEQLQLQRLEKTAKKEYNREIEILYYMLSKKLTSTDFEEIESVDKQASSSQNIDEIRGKIEEAEAHERILGGDFNFSYGLFDEEGELHASLIAFREHYENHQAKYEDAIRVSDKQITSEDSQGKGLQELFKTFSKKISALSLPVIGKQGSLFDSALCKNPSFLQGLGLQSVKEIWGYQKVRIETLAQSTREQVNDALESEEEWTKRPYDREKVNEIDSRLRSAGEDEIIYFGQEAEEVAEFLLSQRWGSASLASNLRKFEGLDHQKIADTLIELGEADILARYIHHLDVDHDEMARKMIRNGANYYIYSSLNNFRELSQDVLVYLISHGYGFKKDWEKSFVNLDYNVLLRVLINGDYQNDITSLLSVAVGIEERYAIQLIERGHGEHVANHLKAFGIKNQTRIAQKLMDHSNDASLAGNLGSLTELDESIAIQLIRNNEGKAVLENKKAFSSFGIEVARACTEKRFYKVVARFPEIYTGCQSSDIADLLLTEGQRAAIAEHMEKYENLSEKVAVGLIESGSSEYMIDHLHRFHELGGDTIDALVSSGLLYKAYENLDAFTAVSIHQKNAIILEHTFQNFLSPQYWLNGVRKWPEISWTESASKKLVEWAIQAIQENPDLGEVQDQALVRYYCGDEAEVNSETIALVKDLSASEKTRVLEVHKLNRSRSIQCSLVDYLAFAPYLKEDRYELAIDAGYTPADLAKFPWLLATVTRYQGQNLPKFPTKSNVNAQKEWCIKNAASLPQGWNNNRLGGVILHRLNQGIDPDLHDASFWLQEFDYPEEDDSPAVDQEGEKEYKDISSEVELLHAMMDVPEALQSKITEKKNKFKKYFSSDAAILIYEALVETHTNYPINQAELEYMVLDKLSEHEHGEAGRQRKKIPAQSLRSEVEDILTRIGLRAENSAISRPIPELYRYLGPVQERAKLYNDQAQTWVMNNINAAHQDLTRTWRERPLALKEGVEDNLSAIKAWIKIRGFQIAFDEMEKNNELPENISREDLEIYDDWVKALYVHYDAGTITNFISWIKKSENHEQHIPAAERSIDEKQRGEILMKNSPEGATIGPETGCCMTLGGASHSCVIAGYERPDCGFFTLKRSNELLAQSFIWVNEEEAPDTLVIDNIEANEGRDVGKILDAYQKFFREYLIEQKKKDPNFKIRKIHVGTGYTSVGLSKLEDVTAIFRPYSGYTDAHVQKILLEIPEEEFNNITPLETSSFEAVSSEWSDIEEEIMEIEQHAFEGKGYTKELMKSLCNNPENITIFLKDGEKIVGYSVAEKRSDETLYVSSTALLPSHQGKGYVKFLMDRLDEEALKRGFRNYERDARSDNGYADSLEKNYTVIEKGEDKKTAYGTQRYLAVEIPGANEKDSVKEEHWEVSGASY
jgi:GNAT superfamily N-acetyltransferase